MKYLILKPVSWAPGRYELQEFETAADTGEFIAKNGRGDSIVAKRMEVSVDICELAPPPADDF